MDRTRPYTALARRGLAAAISLAWAASACSPALIGSGLNKGSAGKITTSVTAQYASVSSNWNDYVRRCTGGTNTCTTVTDGVTACTGAETGGATACMHTGERRTVTTDQTACTDLSMNDSLGVFSWTCSLKNGVAVFTSRLKTTKGLADLITGPGNQTGTGSWNPITVTLSRTGYTDSTASADFSSSWTNVIRELPDNSTSCTADAGPTGPAWTCPGTQNVATLNQAGTIYVLPTSRTSHGYNLGASKISVVTQGSTTVLTSNISGNQCSQTTFLVGATGSCLLAVGSQKFEWIEGNYLGQSTTPEFIFGSATMVFSQIRRANFALSNITNVFFYQAVNNNRFSQIRSGSALGAYDIQFDGHTSGGSSTGNSFWDINVFGSAAGGFYMSGEVDYTVISNLVASSNDSTGFLVIGDQFSGSGVQKMNVFSRITSNDNRDQGILMDASGNGPVQDTIFHNVLVSGNNGNAGTGSAGIQLAATAGGPVTRPTFDQVAVTDTTDAATNGGIMLDYVTNGKFTGNIVVGHNTNKNCNVTAHGTAPGLADTTCANGGVSNATLTTGADPSSSYTFEPTTDTVNTTARNNSGVVAGSSIKTLNNGADWFNFDNMYRGWGIQGVAAWPSLALDLVCNDAGSQCQVYDWSLKAGATVIRNTSNNGSTANNTFVDGAACPAEVDGGKTLTSNTYTYDINYHSGLNGVYVSGPGGSGCIATDTCQQVYLQNAVEIMDDDIGDDDGLCESGEACLYTPNFGAYQGSGTLHSCVFNNGTITGVTMYFYSKNGE